MGQKIYEQLVCRETENEDAPDHQRDSRNEDNNDRLKSSQVIPTPLDWTNLRILDPDKRRERIKEENHALALKLKESREQLAMQKKTLELLQKQLELETAYRIRAEVELQGVQRE